MARSKNQRHLSGEQRRAVTAELEMHLAKVLKEAGGLNGKAQQKLKMAEDLLGRLTDYYDQTAEDELPF